MDINEVKKILEAVIFAAGEPLSVDRLKELFVDEEYPSKQELKKILEEMTAEYEDRSIEFKQLGTGFCFQSRQEYSSWIAKLWQEKPAKYSRALLETLAIIAYRQPVTRAEIEDIRGVAVSSSIIKTLLEREWISQIGHKDVPGKPGIYGTTNQFLDYFSLKSLSELPPLSEVRNFEQMAESLQTSLPLEEAESSEVSTDATTEELEESEEVVIAEGLEMVLDESELLEVEMSKIVLREVEEEVI
ncbi:MAG: SMC-Scp complex subunit ScpB [Proteobacteria bacterium]|nr:SMC-Scp complex subunit ScpB [Pseudomonadota bacterium]